MRVFSSHPVGIEQGDVALFADFEDGGDMWTGTGPRERRVPVRFETPFRDAPVVQVSVSLWDIEGASAVRAEIVAADIMPEGFVIVFRTWSDTRVARVRAAWIAIGEVDHEDDWQIS